MARKPKKPKRKKAERLPAVVVPGDLEVAPELDAEGKPVTIFGRPSAYRPEYATLAARACLVYGSTNDDLAKFFGVAIATIERWIEAHAEFRGALKGGKALSNLKVNESLYRRATGWEHPAEKIFMVDVTTTRTAADGSVVTRTTKRPVRVPYIEHYPGDTTAAIYWTKNREPALWRDRPKDDTEAATDQMGGEMHYHLHMQMPKPASADEDRSYRDGPVIEHQPAAREDSQSG